MEIEFEISNYDFIDFGASKGGSIDFAKKALGGKNGIGIDLNPKKVLEMKANGFDAICADFTKIRLPKKCVSFVVISHVLEHLPSLEIAQKTIKKACELAKDFVFIQGPYFDGDKYLAENGLKFFWSDWRGHTYHLTVKELRNILSSLKFVEYKIFMNKEVIDSGSEFIHPFNSPTDQYNYDERYHPKKDLIVFDKKLYREFVCYIKLNPDLENWEKIIKSRKNVIMDHNE